jgi:hypothetical protein
MSTRRQKPKNYNPQFPAHHPVHPIASSSTATEISGIDPDILESADLTETDILPPPPPTRTNNQLNLSVLQRHYPSLITSVVSNASYAVIYAFSPSSSAWEKVNIEGTLFVCELSPQIEGGEEGYAVVVLNRRGLSNFFLQLRKVDDVEITEEYVILKDEDEDKIWGVWIFSEPAPASTSESRRINAGVIKECAARAEAGRSKGQSATVGEAMGRQLSLRELFGQQRVEDQENGREGPEGGTHWHEVQTSSTATTFAPARDTEFFRTTTRPSQRNPEV